MTAVTLKNVPVELYERVKQNAKANHRSINNELINIIERSVMPQPLDVQAWLEKARQRLKNEGKK